MRRQGSRGTRRFLPECVACVWLPRFPLQAERERCPELPPGPLVLVGRGATGSAPVVRTASPEALAAGVREGAPAHSIPQRCPGARLLPFDTPYYQARFCELLLELDRITPTVEPALLTAFYLDLTGLPHLDGWDPEAVLRALQAVIPERYPVRVGISSGKFTAWVAANRAAAQRPVVVPHQAKREFLQDAPATLLPVDALLARQLHLLGLRTLDRISQLPRSALLARFGRPGEWIHRLASGDDREPLVPYCPDPVLRETLAFPDTAPTQAHFLLALGRLLRRIWMRPERGGRAVRQVRLEAGLELGGSWERLVTLRKPCERWEAAFAELKRRLEGLLPSAALTELSVELTALATRIDAQGVLFQSEAQHRMERLRLEVEQLVERQRIDGPAPVLRIVEVDPWSFLPEERYGLIRYDF